VEGPLHTLCTWIGNRRFGLRHGSALILTVVLTSLLAVIGVLFALLSRLDRMAATAMVQERQLDLATDAVIGSIGRQLVLDAPGVGAAEYYDYPDQNDPFLASLEPSLLKDGTAVWAQISDPTGYIRARGWVARDVAITTSPGVPASEKELFYAYQSEYRPIAIDPCTGEPLEQLADADGDGIADAKWTLLEDLSTSTGKRFYLATRIIDNCGMLNLNTSYSFDPNDPCLSDGLHQMQVDMLYLSRRGNNGGPVAASKALMAVRSPGQADWRPYLLDVVWNNGYIRSEYAPFDISDELRLRYRYVINYNKAPARLEWFWQKAFEGGPSVPVGTDTYYLNDWFTLTGLRPEQAGPERIYDYRHICTVYSADRLVDPCGLPQVNLNAADANTIFVALLKAGLDQGQAAQLAVNIRDFVDNDSNATSLRPIGSAVTYWGLEPQPFIRQIGFTISSVDPTRQGNNEFVVELYNPFTVPIDLGNCVLALVGQKGGRAEVRLPATIGAGQYLTISSRDRDRGNLVLALYEPTSSGGFQLRERYDLYLVRRQGSNQIYLDRQRTQDGWFDWNLVKGISQYYARPDARWNIVYQQMSLVGQSRLPPTPLTRSDDSSTWDWVYSRATRTNYNLPSPQKIWPSGRMGLLTVGQVGRLLMVGPKADDIAGTLGDQLADEPPEASIRLDLSRSPAVLNYVTVMLPVGQDRQTGQSAVKGRININTASPFVLDRLPWIQWAGQKIGSDIGQAIVQYRHDLGAFDSIARLLQVPQMQAMVGLAEQEDHGPDLTPDGQYDDLEARDVLFARISNLVTVRSDIFTAYLLIRLGEDGPQRRIMAIFDRSQVRTANDRPRLIALHQVPDPR